MVDLCHICAITVVSGDEQTSEQTEKQSVKSEDAADTKESEDGKLAKWESTSSKAVVEFNQWQVTPLMADTHYGCASDASKMLSTTETIGERCKTDVPSESTYEHETSESVWIGTIGSLWGDEDATKSQSHTHHGIRTGGTTTVEEVRTHHQEDRNSLVSDGKITVTTGHGSQGYVYVSNPKELGRDATAGSHEGSCLRVKVEEQGTKAHMVVEVVKKVDTTTTSTNDEKQVDTHKQDTELNSEVGNTSTPVYGPNTYHGRTTLLVDADAITTVLKGLGYIACLEHSEGKGALRSAVAEQDVIGKVSETVSVHLSGTGGVWVGASEIMPCIEMEIDSPGEQVASRGGAIVSTQVGPDMSAEVGHDLCNVHPERTYETKSTADSTHQLGPVGTCHLALNMVEHGDHAIGFKTTMDEMCQMTCETSLDTQDGSPVKEPSSDTLLLGCQAYPCVTCKKVSEYLLETAGQEACKSHSRSNEDKSTNNQEQCPHRLIGERHGVRYTISP